MKQRTAELEAANQQLRQLSHTDSLTGLMNRRALQYAVSLLQTQRSRTQAPMTLALMDIDHFKDINDQYGHDIGDAVLVELYAICSSAYAVRIYWHAGAVKNFCC